MTPTNQTVLSGGGGENKVLHTVHACKHTGKVGRRVAGMCVQVKLFKKKVYVQWGSQCVCGGRLGKKGRGHDALPPTITAKASPAKMNQTTFSSQPVRQNAVKTPYLPSIEIAQKNILPKCVCVPM